MDRLANLLDVSVLREGEGVCSSGIPLAKCPMISIIDDDKSVRDAANMLLKSLGYVTATFASAEDFLQSGRLHDTACLISDVQMPGMGGVELQNHLISNGDCTPVIFVTAYPNEATRERVFRAGAIGYLSKPFREENLIACLDKAMQRHNSALE